MGRGYTEENIFSKNIDLLLAGKETELSSEISEDMRKALDFVQKMMTVRPEPSSTFQANLKARLLQELSEQDNKPRSGWFWKLIPREPIWQAVAVIAIVLVIGGALWGSLSRTDNPQWSGVVIPTPASPVYVPDTYLAAFGGTDKPVYTPGEKVKMGVTLKNVTNQPLTLDQYPPILSLMQTGSGQPVYTFKAGQATKILASGESATFILTWDQQDEKGRHVSPGGYYLELENLELPGQTIKLNLYQPVYFEISPAASGVNGAIKNLNVNQTVTVGGIMVTLKQIELMDNGFRVSAFVTPPADYLLIPGTPTLKATQNYQAPAGYSIDGRWMEDIGVSTVEYFADGMQHNWYIPNPVPSNAEKMIFVVNMVGNQPGPWQFEIPLK